MYKNSMSLHDGTGQRKYLNQSERLRFLEVTQNEISETRLFCQLLYFTGARISEIHNLTTDRIDLSNGTVVIECLKKRKKGIFREIPLPDCLLRDLDYYINEMEVGKEGVPLWPYSLRTASRKVNSAMDKAGIDGIRGSAKGLRHGFAVHAVTKVPLTLVKKWLGHDALETTEIYLNIVGVEEREIASRIW